MDVLVWPEIIDILLAIVNDWEFTYPDALLDVVRISRAYLNF